MDPGLQRLLDATIADIARERGVRAWLRARPTRWRWALAIGVAALVPAAVAIASHRPDLGVYPGPRLGLEIGASVLAIVATVIVALWPMQRAPSRARGVVLGLAALVLPLIASLPSAHQLDPRSLAGAGDDVLARAGACFGYALVTALPAAVAIRWLRRDRGGARPIELALALAGALVGGLTVFLHCPIVHGVHLWLGHVTVLVPFLVWALLRMRR